MPQLKEAAPSAPRLGAYRIERRIGQGAATEVFLAQDQRKKSDLATVRR